jgi:hypothetical protein
VRFLVLSDIHGRLEYLRDIEEEVRRSDGVILAGDLTQKGKGAAIAELANGLRRPGLEIVGVLGNLDLPLLAKELEALGIFNLEASGRLVHGIAFSGVGGSNPTPFFTPYERKEDEIKAALLKGAQILRGARPWVVVSHPPPFDSCLDKTFFGLNAGSKALKEFLLERGPDVCVCGHIHEALGTARLGPTLIVNPGPFQSGHYAILAYEKEQWHAELSSATTNKKKEPRPSLQDLDKSQA